jgi:activator of HSP90 ATPase
VQAWRTTEFPEAAADSLLVIKLDKKAGNKTILTLTQTGLPRGHAKKYKKGWKQHYFEPMKVYFAAK